MDLTGENSECKPGMKYFSVDKDRVRALANR